MGKVNKPDNVNGGATPKKAAPPPPKADPAKIADAKIQAWHCECREKAQRAEADRAFNAKFGLPTKTPPDLEEGSACDKYLEGRTIEKSFGGKNLDEIEKQECDEAAKPFNIESFGKPKYGPG